MFKSITIIALIASIAIVHARVEEEESVATIPTHEFDFQSWFVGHWDVYKSTASFRTAQHTYSPVFNHYVIQKENGTNHLVGTAVTNDTSSGQLGEELYIHVSFDTTSTGTFFTGHDEDNIAPLFTFSFTSPENGVPMSFGEWNGEGTHAYYQMVLSDKDKFVITVIPKQYDSNGNPIQSPIEKKTTVDEDEFSGANEERVRMSGTSGYGNGQMIIYTGRRVTPIPEKTFFQKYGTVMMLGAFFIFNIFLKSRTQNSQVQRATAARDAARGKVMRGGKATIEEIEDEPKKAK